MEGFLNVRKAAGWTSHDVVQVIRRLTGTRRVGHAGTLDPAATGVLVVAVGRATRLLDYLLMQDKCYRAEVVFGAATTTDDAEGEVVRTGDVSRLTFQDVSRLLPRFLGEIWQLPPQYSAVKLQGRKAYQLARKGEWAEMEPRAITVRGIAVEGWGRPRLSMLVCCSKGTYIRGLARDMGDALGVGAHLGALSRISSGAFTLEDAASLDTLKEAASEGTLARWVTPLDRAVAHLPEVRVSAATAAGIMNGSAWPVEGAGQGAGVARVYDETGRFLGLAEARDGCWRPKLVFEGARVGDG